MAERERLPEELSELLSLEARVGDPGPAEPLGRARERALVDAALAEWTASAAPAAARRRPAWVGWGLAAAALCLGSAAAYYVATGGPAGEEPAAAPVAASAREPATGPTPMPEPPAEPAPAAEPEPDVRAPDEGERGLPEPDSARSAQDWLARANALRGQGRYADAEHAYLRAVRSAPRGSSAHAARVAAADLRLERLGDARGALALYRQAARRPGPLALEAQAGVARALGQLGRHDEEQGALERLLRKHPTGPTAAWARERLRELQAR